MKFPIGEAAGGGGGAPAVAAARWRSAPTRAGSRSRSTRRRPPVAVDAARPRRCGARRRAAAQRRPRLRRRTRWGWSISPRARRRNSTRFAASRSTATSRRGSRCRAIPETAARRARDAAAGAVAVARRRRAAPRAAAAQPRHRSGALQSRDGDAVNVGNVAEFGFDDSGDWLAYTIDARDQIGNGVQLRNMRTDVVRAIDSDRALYRHLVWADSGDALAVLRGGSIRRRATRCYSVVALHERRGAVAEEDRVRSGRSTRLPGRA